MSFIREASDVAALPKAPNIEFIVRPPHVITGECDGFSIRIEAISDERAHVRISLDGQPFCACEYIYTPSPHFAEEDITGEVTGFVSGLVWSAWRRRELTRIGAVTGTEEAGEPDA